jgi:hypothetical protein
MCGPNNAKSSTKSRLICYVNGCENGGKKSLLRTKEKVIVCQAHFDNFRNQWLFSEKCSAKCLRENPHSRCEHTQCCSSDCGELAEHSVWTRNSAGMPIQALACDKHAVPRYVVPFLMYNPYLGYVVYGWYHC